MCTASWIKGNNKRILFFSRDEMASRPQETPPKIYGDKIYPLDPQGKGTWLGINKSGLAIGLLNYYPNTLYSEPRNSRGQLVLSLLSCYDLSSVKNTLQKHVDCYAPFFLLVADDSYVWQWTWDTHTLVLEKQNPDWGMLTTSSARSQESAAARSQTFAEIVEKTPEALEQFHRSHHPELGPLSVCMHRANAHTKSLSTIEVTEATITYRYAYGSPCQNFRQNSLHLTRSAIC